jgi:putative transposase
MRDIITPDSHRWLRWLSAAIRTVYPRVRHQRCWVHKMRNILEKARKLDYGEVKAGG